MCSRLLSLDTRAAIAHRGGSKLGPENTLAAFRRAMTFGVDAIECDVHLSADGEPVVIHDDTLDRTTDARGAVSALTARQLGRVDAGARFGADAGYPFRGQGVGVPRLAEVLSLSTAISVVIEIKGGDVRTADRVLAVVREMRAEERVIVGGFHHEVIAHVRRSGRVPTSASRPEVLAALRRSWFFLSPRRTGFALFQIPVRLAGRAVLSRRLVQLARRVGIPVQAWIVDDASEMRALLAWGVTGLISDRPDLAVAAVREGA